jgi:putative ABC transport system substrate-binding protein
MKRLAVLLTLALLAASLTVGAQPAGKVPRIGFLAPGPTPMNVAALREGLRELGYVEPTNLILEARWGDGRLDRLPTLAADLVRFRIDVIVTDSNAAALAAKDATTTIPIVMGTGSSDPVGYGLAASIAHQGKRHRAHAPDPQRQTPQTIERSGAQPDTRRLHLEPG